MLRIAAGVALALGLGGCAVTPNPDSIGPYPADYKEVIKAHLQRVLFDPYSVRSASISSPMQGHLYFQQGWIVCVEMNAKNRMGGYVGIQRTAYLLSRSTITRSMEKAPLCDNAQVSLVPWPELEQAK